jgi:hypothetical protein
VENVFKVLPLFWLLGVEQLEELLDEFVGDECLQALDVRGVVDDQLEEEFVDWLQVRPRSVHHDLFFLDTHFIRSAFFYNRQRTEDVLLNHVHHSIKVRNYEVDHMVLVGQQIAKFGDVLQSFVLLRYHLVVIIEVEDLAAELHFFKEVLLAFYSCENPPSKI